MKKAVMVVPLFALILISGCVGIPDVFGRDVVSVQQNTVKNGVRDIISLSDILTIPKSPLLPDQQVMFSFIATNNDNLKPAHVVVDLFNAPTMRDVTGSKPCNLYTGSTATSYGCAAGSICKFNCGSGETQVGQCSIPSSDGSSGVCCQSNFQASETRYCLPDQCGVDQGGCNILPGEQKQITFPLRTPGEAEIANIKTDTKLDFKVTYEFKDDPGATLTYLIPAITTDEIIKRQRSGDKTTLFTSKSYSSGPVQIDVQIQGAPYMLSDSTGRVTDTVLLFSIKNVGSGNILNSQINSGDMTIVFPPEFVVDDAPNKHSDKFQCTTYGNEGTTCINIGKDGADSARAKNDPSNVGIIPLYKDESRSSLYFTVHLGQTLQEPFKTFQISSYVKYQYELRNSVALTINPFQNV